MDVRSQPSTLPRITVNGDSGIGLLRMMSDCMPFSLATNTSTPQPQICCITAFLSLISPMKTTGFASIRISRKGVVIIQELPTTRLKIQSGSFTIKIEEYNPIPSVRRVTSNEVMITSRSKHHLHRFGNAV